jgi:hypothetical protein
METEIVTYEHNLLKPLTLIEKEIVTKYTEGYSVKAIAIELGLEQRIIKNILSKPEIREIANDIILGSAQSLKAERIRLLSAIIEDKVKVIEEKVDDEGNPSGRMANLSNKDVVDLVKTVDDMLKEREKAELGTSSANVYVQLVNSLIG